MDLSIRIFDITFPIFAVVFVGFICGRTIKPDMKAANQLNMDVFIPALIFSVIIGQSVDVREYYPLLIAAFAVVLGSGLLAWPVAKICKLSPKTLLPPVMFNNAGNLGLPLMALTFGEQALPIAMILFLVENTLHFTLGMAWLNNSGKSRLGTLMSPLIVISVIAVLLGMANVSMPKVVMAPIDMIGQIAIPLMLFGLGVRLSNSSFKVLSTGLVGGIICPISGLIIAMAVIPFIELTPMQTGSLLLFSVLPPAILNFMFAERYHQEPDKVASIVIVGNLLTLLTLPLALSYVIPRFT